MSVPHGALKQADLDAILAAVGPALNVQYNKPHVYPMAAPMFVKRPGVVRPHPPEGPIEVYVHVPFCNYKCNFCTYATRQGAQAEQHRRYVDCLKSELDWLEPGTPLLQLYVGGGTPTVLAAPLLGEVLGAVGERVDQRGSMVNSVECSPESLTPAHVDVFREHGIGRISMGVQSLEARVLHMLNRRHSPDEALAAIDLLLAGGVMVNVDLIYGLPTQAESSFAADFRTVAGRGVHSVTVYNLRLNERTPVAGALQEEERLGLEQLVRWRALVAAVAAEQGFTQTRWHTFLRQRQEDGPRHPAARYEDLTTIGNQLGVGMSARSRLDGTVYRNHVDLDAYHRRIAAGESPVEEVFELGEEDRRTLFISQFLGSGQPLDTGAYERAFACPFEEDFASALPRLRAGGLIEEADGVISLSPTGKLVFDLVTWMFYPQRARDWIAQRQHLGRPARAPRGQSGTRSAP
jgi:oxygen-independent coproporphyrinogen-3 oxidase